MQPVLHDPARLETIFDDDHAVANAGLALVAVLSQALGIEAAADDVIDLGGRPAASRPGRKILTLVHSMAVGGDCIDDVDVLRSGSTDRVLGHRVMAPSTCGIFLRSFTFGHVRQLDRLFDTVLARAWAAGAGPGDEAMTIDLDSTICDVHGYQKQGAEYGYTKQLGYHPLVATRADTGEVLHIRQRRGSAHTARGTKRFIAEFVARLRRAGASGALTLRADAGFYAWETITTLKDRQVAFSITVPKNPAVVAAIATIRDKAWIRIGYPNGGIADVGEICYKGERLIVRRTRNTTNNEQGVLFDDWEYHAFITNREGDATFLDADHRRHAVVELAIRDWKEGSAGNHAPSGIYAANAAWVVLAALAHNLIRWVAALGLGVDGPVVTKTIRRRLITLPGRITTRSRRYILHLPTRWPWETDFLTATHRLQGLPRLC
ncbi:MAG: IS1380 family transposase [Actinomycetota bacterium]|nr:IS1380 family transposase [Actinomycetota bacterium]